MMREALEMVRDADNDCRKDGLKTIPPAARRKIDKALEENNMTENELKALAWDALPRSEDDWGSKRQIEAENAFYAAAENYLPRKTFSELEDWLLKATSEEGIRHTMFLVHMHKANEERP